MSPSLYPNPLTVTHNALINKFALQASVLALLTSIFHAAYEGGQFTVSNPAVHCCIFKLRHQHETLLPIEGSYHSRWRMHVPVDALIEDIKRVKDLMQSIRSFHPALKTNDKESRGFNHPQIGWLLVSAEKVKEWDEDEEFHQRIKEGIETFRPQDYPVFLLSAMQNNLPELALRATLPASQGLHYSSSTRFSHCHLRSATFGARPSGSAPFSIYLLINWGLKIAAMMYQLAWYP
ncbi:hypothetical protein JB92DRAFT_2826745 [Gautieria morchelliformis]|nr:hypothetical protein JB92DRAFT_2826745 [Gautieria morchelliformis]